MKFILCGLSFSLLLITISAIFPSDKITLTSFNKTYYLQDEVYTFDLVNTYQVPVKVLRHKIYTATTQAVQTQMKRALFQQQQNLEELSPDDHDLLLNYLGSVPHFVQVNKKKRSLPLTESGFRIIPLTKKHFILHTIGDDRESVKKRGLLQENIPLGSSICFHIPFFTTCDNSADLSAVKTALQAQVSAIRTELDSYKATNDARASELAKALNQQRGLITEIAQNTKDTNNMIAMIASSVAVNAAQTAHGDYIVHAQVNYLKRVTDSLLKYSNALASSDPRTVVAQPSMSKLFEGYKTILGVITGEGYLPIVDARTFDFTEKALPQHTVNNFTATTGTFIDPAASGDDYLGFSIFLQGYCNEINDLTCKSSTYSPTGWIFGPFHKNHYGIYPLLYQNGSATVQMKATEVRPIVSGLRLHSTSNPLYCIQFLGYTMLADFQTTPNLINGLPAGSSAVPITNCDTYRLTNSNETINKNIFRLFSVNEGVVIPFYSNCDLNTLRAAYPNIPIGYMSHYPDTSASGSPSPPDNVPNGRDVFTRHWVSSSCYINMDPAWIEMKYYIQNATKVISKIPRGYDLNQFTINPEGELASSIEFLYTDRWAWVSTIVRTSDNNIITNEIDVLTGDTVLFDFPILSPTLIDESDAFFGEGNNGRDCVHKKDNYEYDLLSCFYQNDQQGYTASQYQGGDVITTGIARFNNKFHFSLKNTSVNGVIPSWSFTLRPKPDSDFTFYVQTDKFICPKLISQNNSVSGCTFSFVYTGSDSVQLNGKSTNVLQFTNSTTTITVPLSNGNDYTLTVGVPPKECLIIPCSYGSTTSSISLVTPNVEIFPSSEVNLESKVYFAIDATINKTVTEMNDVQQSVLTANENLTKIVEELAKLNFNVSELVPYEDFTALRAQVDAMISTLLDSASGAKPCDSPWESADCFFQQFGTTLITIGAVLGVIIVGYVVLFKFGVAKKITDKCKKGKSNSVPMSSQ